MTPVAIIGDIHGCIVEFEELVAKLQKRSVKRIILVGDLMDKGPDPVACVQFARHHGFECVLGNHEEKHIRWRKHEDKKLVDPEYVNPMRPLKPEDQKANAALSETDVEWLRSLPLFLRLQVNGRSDWVVVHGGLFPGKPVEEQAEDKDLRDKLYRLRLVHHETNKFMVSEYTPEGKALGAPPEAVHWTQRYDWYDHVIYGHEAFSLSGVRMDHLPDHDVECYGIDTGCVHGGRLTALILDKPRPLSVSDKPSVSSIQVQARKTYEEPPCFIPA